MKVEPFKVLSESELKQVDTATMQILSEVGVKIDNEKVLGILAGSGAKVDGEKKIVRLDEQLVRKALSTVSSQVKLFSRDLKESITLGQGRTTIGSGHNAIYILDMETGERRETTKEDIAKFSIITDALDDMDILGIEAMPQDVKPEASLLHAYEASVHNTNKHIYFSPETVEVVRPILEMAKVSCGSDDLFAASPVTCQLSPTSPLTWEPQVVDGVVECAKAGVPLVFLPEPLPGMTAPVTIAGMLAQHGAEVLSGVVIAQLVRPGTPVIWGCAWTTFDMKKANCLISSPEAAILRVAGTQLAGYYNIPSHSIGLDTDAHSYDQQMGWEKILTTLAALGSGVDLQVNAGMFSTGLTVSFEQLVIDAEIASICRRFLEGIKIDEHTLAVHIIKEVGHKGDFMYNSHTLENLRAGALWEENVSNKCMYDKWKENGAISLIDSVKEKVRSILASHQPAKLPKDVQSDMRKIIEEFEVKH